MHDLVPYGELLLLVALALLLGVASHQLAAWVRVPAPALFLVVAAVASDLVSRLYGLDAIADQRIVTVALVLVLFDGGLHIGWSRMRPAAGAVLWLGVAGTVVTAGALAVLAHLLLGFEWRTALVLGAALAPTDPAVVFSVLGRREISGRSGTLLEGESGANDPVGIALMISLLGATGSGWHAVGEGAAQFGLQMVVGGGVGLCGGWLTLQLMRRVPLPSGALYPVQTIAVAFALYGAATALEGSGYLAVFVAGIYLGDQRAPYKREVEQFVGALASVAEIVAFAVLGLSIHLSGLASSGALWQGLLIGVLLTVAVRPLLVGLVLAPVRLTRGERAFVLLSGLKGAVPILLGTYVLVEQADRARQLYDIVFVVVLVSVVVQGSLVPTLARWFAVPMRVTEPEPWALGMRFREQPTGLHRYVVAARSTADGCTLADLDVGEGFWVSLVSRNGRLVQVRGDTRLRAGDEVLALAEDDDSPDHLFAGPGLTTADDV